jgi:CRP-like cAMP-binding protein
MTAPNGGGSNHPHPWPAELAAEETVVYPAGTTLFRERDRVKSVQIIVSGVVRTSVMRGGGELFLGVCGPGWPLSAVPALLEGIQITTAVAVTETEVTRCSLDRFQRHRRDVPEVADWLQRMFAKEAGRQLRRWATVVPKGTREGLTWLLLDLFRRFAEAGVSRAGDGARRMAGRDAADRQRASCGTQGPARHRSRFRLAGAAGV